MKLSTYQSLISRVGSALRRVNETIAADASRLGLYGDEFDKMLYANLSKAQRERVKLEELQRDLRAEHRDTVQLRREIRAEVQYAREESNNLLKQAFQLSNSALSLEEMLAETE